MAQIFQTASFVIAWLGYNDDKVAAVDRFLHTRLNIYLEMLATYSYFSGLWVVQGLLLAGEIRYMCGHVWIPFLDLYVCARKLEVPAMTPLGYPWANA
jgi:hypothetical protein